MGATYSRVRRAVSRRVAVARGAAGNKPVPVRTYWWDEVANFGDQLNVDILQDLGYAPRWTPPANAELLPIGSLIEHTDSRFDGFIWGTGLMHDHQVSLAGARILAVRGLLTWSNIGKPSGVALGDPGLLSRRTYGPTTKTGKIALVPHFRHHGDALLIGLLQKYPDDFFAVDVTRPPADVVRLIGGARCVISTSLHGLIVADSYGIPAAWWQTEPPLGGGDFKFRDYESVFSDFPTRKVALDSETTPEDIVSLCRAVPESRVQEIGDNLIEVLDRNLPRSREGLSTWKASIAP